MLPIRYYSPNEIDDLNSRYRTLCSFGQFHLECVPLSQDIKDAEFYNALFSNPRNCGKATQYINQYVVPTLQSHSEYDTDYLHDLFSAYIYWTYFCATNTEINSFFSTIVFRPNTFYDDAYTTILQDARPFESSNTTQQKLSTDTKLIDGAFSQTFQTINFKPVFSNTATLNRAMYVLYLVYMNLLADKDVFYDKDKRFLTYLFATYPGIYRLKFKGVDRYWYDYVRPNTPNAIRFPNNSPYSNKILELAPQVIQYIRTKHSNVLRDKIKTPEEMQAFVNDVGLTFQIPISVQVDSISRSFPQTEGDSGRVIVGFTSQIPSNVADIANLLTPTTNLTNIKDVRTTLLTTATNLSTQETPAQETPAQETPAQETPKSDSPQFTSATETTPWYKTGVGISVIILGISGVGVGAYFLTKTKNRSL